MTEVTFITEFIFWGRLLGKIDLSVVSSRGTWTNTNTENEFSAGNGPYVYTLCERFFNHTILEDNDESSYI